MSTSSVLAVVALVSFACIGSSSALAQKAQSADPNAKVCETVSQVGSRLSKKKVCATRAEWAEMKRQDREVIDQAQRASQIGCSIAPALSNGPVPAC
jgi:hypothetical protein